MMFRFDFSKDTNEENNLEEPQIEWAESREVTPNTALLNKLLDNKTLECNNIDLKDVQITVIAPKSVIAILNENDLKNDIMRAENNHSDLITGVYEGGLKIWECTHDLARFIYEKQLSFEEKNVLDLGCGAGIVGMQALLKGASVDFQDYNYDVIRYITMLNVHLTLKSEEVTKRCKFYCGDWKSFTDILCGDKYDYIFTSETIYNVNNYNKLINLFRSLLKADGKIYLAAKTYYFGIGGGTRQFEDCLKNDGSFLCRIVWRCNEGVNREILEIVRK